MIDTFCMQFMQYKGGKGFGLHYRKVHGDPLIEPSNKLYVYVTVCLLNLFCSGQLLFLVQMVRCMVPIATCHVIDIPIATPLATSTPGAMAPLAPYFRRLCVQTLCCLPIGINIIE